MFSLYDRRQLESFRSEHGIDPYHFKRMLRRHLIEACDIETSLAEIPQRFRDIVRQNVRFSDLTLQQRQDSDLDEATKILFRTAGQSAVETVILRAPNRRVSVCVSSQAGCAAGCQFCATTLMPSVVNLSCGEIVDQIVQVNRQLVSEQRLVRNVVFMGMGEPFHNIEAVSAALEWLHHQQGMAMSPRRTVVSTVGIPDAMVTFARHFRRVPLALSLHSADQIAREELIPLARKYHVDQLHSAVAEVNRIQNQPVLLEYLMLADFNDSLEQADLLASYLNGLEVLINLIPYNPIPSRPDLAPTAREGRNQFATRLRERGFNVTIRYSQGSDIAAACGQLAGSA